MSRGENCTCAEEDEFHSCPFAAEIHDNEDEEFCSCCPDCTYECAQDI